MYYQFQPHLFGSPYLKKTNYNTPRCFAHMFSLYNRVSYSPQHFPSSQCNVTSCFSVKRDILSFYSLSIQTEIGALEKVAEKFTIILAIDVLVLRQRQHILAARNGRKDVTTLKFAKLENLLGVATWTKPATLTTEREQVLVTAFPLHRIALMTGNRKCSRAEATIPL